jgi:hypothetical protein
MNNDIKNLINKYMVILEGEDISDTFKSQVSTKYTTDNTQKFLPIAQDQAEEEKIDKEKRVRNNIKEPLQKLKSLIDACLSKDCNYKRVSALMHFIDDPQFKKDLELFKNALQTKNMELGGNSTLAF